MVFIVVVVQLLVVMKENRYVLDFTIINRFAKVIFIIQLKLKSIR